VTKVSGRDEKIQPRGQLFPLSEAGLTEKVIKTGRGHGLQKNCKIWRMRQNWEGWDSEGREGYMFGTK